MADIKGLKIGNNNYDIIPAYVGQANDPNVGMDANELRGKNRTSTCYFFNTGKLSNAPFTNWWGSLLVFCYHTDYVQQVAIYGTGGTIYTRALGTETTSGTWSEWKKVSNIDELPTEEQINSWNGKVDLAHNGPQVIHTTYGDTPLALQSNEPNSSFLGFKNNNWSYLGYLGVSDGKPTFFDTTGHELALKEDVDIHLTELKMLGWTVPDEMSISNTVENGVFHQKIGRVDLGELDWVYESDFDRFSSRQSLTDFAYHGASDKNTYWKGHTQSPSPIQLARVDKTYAIYVTKGIYTYDFAYNDGDNFKQSLQGQYLYYELASEILIPIDGNEKDVQLEENLNTLAYGEITGSRNLLDIPNVNIIATPNSQESVIIFKFDVIQNKMYTLSWNQDTTLPSALRNTFVYDDGTTREYANPEVNANLSAARYSWTFVPTKTGTLTFIYWANNVPSEIKLSHIMLEEGASATPYHPYIKSNKMLGDEISILSDAITDIKFLGWTVPEEMDLHNYVDKDGKFHQRVQRVDLGSLSWVRQASNGVFWASLSNYNFVSDVKAFIHKYPYHGTTASTSNVTNKTFNLYFDSGAVPRQIYINDTTYSDIDSFKSAIQGVYLYYELATELTISEGNEAEASNVKRGNKFGNPVDISGYNSATNYFSAPQDGFIRLANGVAEIDAMSSGATSYYAFAKINNANDCISLFIPKGFQIFVASKDTNATTRFFPLIN